jgi:paraquat-inducible protein A
MVACHECDLLHRLPEVPEGAAARCCRCGAVLLRNKPDSFERTLAWAVAGLILFAVANAFPFLSFKMRGLVQETLLVTGIRQLFAQEMPGLAALVAFTTLVAPGAQLAGLVYVLVPLRLKRKAPGTFAVFGWLQRLKPWGMPEVFMLGILVSMVKLAKMAQIVPGVAVFAFMALIFVLAAAMNSLDPHDVWDRWEGSR